MRRVGSRRAAVEAAALVLAASLPAASTAAAQAPDVKPLEAVVAGPPSSASGWKRSVELAANLFLGAETQTVLTSRGQVAHADSSFELGLDARYTYGSTTREGERALTQRSWLTTFSLDGWPLARHSPFALALAESSFERRIRFRVSAGLGHKLTFARSEHGQGSLSLALIGERTTAPDSLDVLATERLVRWSARLRFRHRIGDRGESVLESFFRPTVKAFDHFTSSNTVSLGYRMTRAVLAKVSYLDNYDSEAKLRGAASGYEGQLMLGVQADF